MWRAGNIRISHIIHILEEGCSCLDWQNKGFVSSTHRLQMQQAPQQDWKLFSLMYLETLPKGYGQSRPSCSVQECILHRSAHLLSVSAFLVQEGLCCSKHITLFYPPPPGGHADWERDQCSAPTDTAVLIQHLARGTWSKGMNKMTSQLTLKNLWDPLWRWIILLLAGALGNHGWQVLSFVETMQ